MSKQKYSQSLVILLVANFVTILGILFLNWKTPEIVLAFWTESAIIGFFTILKMARTKRVSPKQTKRAIPIKMKFFLIPFFIFHYGIFMFVHITFILIILSASVSLPEFSELIKIISIIFLSLLFSHSISFYTNFIRNKEYNHSSVMQIMFSPYKRILTMHFTIILGIFVYVFFIVTDSNAGVEKIFAILLTSIKIVADATAHMSERKRFS